MKRRNLRNLINVLKKTRFTFDMESNDPIWQMSKVFPRGTNESWFDYSNRMFGLCCADQEWLWCFASIWKKVDNTVDGAILRIEWLLSRGKVPPNWGRQCLGLDELCYR